MRRGARSEFWTTNTLDRSLPLPQTSRELQRPIYRALREIAVTRGTLRVGRYTIISRASAIRIEKIIRQVTDARAKR
jgi:hypothetical protein